MKIAVTVFIFCTVALFVASVSPSQAGDSPASYVADDYAICGACHLADGAGIPGVFPPIRNRLASIAKIEGGRAYLATTVSYGLMGNIEVAGMPYFGVMAGNSGMLDVAQIAAALNYAVFELNDEDVEGIEPFTAEEIEAIQAATTTKGPNAAAEQRKEVVAAAGEQWP